MDCQATSGGSSEDEPCCVKEQADTAPTCLVEGSSAAATQRINTGSQATFLQNMETTHQFDPASTVNGDNISESASSSNSSKRLDSSDKSSSKGQRAGNISSEEDESNNNDTSDTEAVHKLLQKHPKIFKQLLSKDGKKKEKPKDKSRKKRTLHLPR
jgi:hypothetical protein